VDAQLLDGVPIEAVTRAKYPHRERLIKSGGRNTLTVQADYRDEKIAREQLPNGGAITVIVAEIARGGLNQAVLAIDDARRRIDAALGEPA